MAARYRETLGALVAHGVDFVVVGAVSAVLQGAPVVTFDVDVVHRRTPDNVRRLLAALRDIDARYRGDPRRLVPTEAHLMGPGHQLLDTRLGDLDVLGTIEEQTTYEDLIADTIEMDLGGVVVRVLELSRLIRAKEAAARPKDFAALPVLRATLEEVRKRSRE